MEKYFLKTILSCAAITLIAIGIDANSLILVCTGGFLVGLYNAMLHKWD